MEEIHVEDDEEKGIKVNLPNKKIEEAKEHHLDEDSLDTTWRSSYVELVGLGSSSSMESFASWRWMAEKSRRKKEEK